jgi:hypothetical protein
MDRDKFTQGSVHAILSPALTVVAQLLSDRLVSIEPSGEAALGWAVLTDGLEQYWQLARHPEARHSARFQEEENWVFADDREYPLSFINLCEIFGLKVDAVRSTLLAWKQAHVAGAGQVIPQP